MVLISTEQFQISDQMNQRNFDVIRIGIQAPREIIYERINERVDLMIDNGLLKEVQSLIPFKNNLALQTVGYSELFNYTDGTWTLDFAIEEIKKNSRRFAKRQLTAAAAAGNRQGGSWRSCVAMVSLQASCSCWRPSMTTAMPARR